jgi:hypothetical protein
VGRNSGASLVRQGGRANNIPAQGFMGVTMNPFMTEQRGFILKKSPCAESATQFFACEQTNRISGRRTTTTMQRNSTGVSRCPSRLPGGRDISLTRKDRGFARSRLSLFVISLLVMPILLGNPIEVRGQNESSKGSLFY